MFRRLILFLLPLAFVATGCGSFVARRIAQAPNSYPTWFAPRARVELALGSNALTAFPAHYIEIGPPAARMRYRVIEPADYQFKVSSTNWVDHGHPGYRFTFNSVIPGATNAWTAAPRGTVILLHGYGLAQFAMSPWALRLAEDGWRCVLVDLRGHGKSTGDRIFFGLQETRDLSHLLDELAARGQLAMPVAAVGESYGAALALRWKGVEPRVGRIIAIAPYASLSNAVLNIARDYAGWTPEWLIKSGLRQLPTVLKTEPGELDTTTVLNGHPVPALFIAGGDDRIAPPSEVEKLRDLASLGSQYILVPQASHEAVTYFFSDLAPPVVNWLDAEIKATNTQ